MLNGQSVEFRIGLNRSRIKKVHIFLDRKYYVPNPNPIRVRVKWIKTSYKSNYKFKSNILKQNAQIVQIKYINLKLDDKSHMHNL